LSHCTGDWAFYIQADEVVHEDDLPAIQEAMRRHLGNPEVKGLLFRYLHFIADYWSTTPWFYHRAVRIIRNSGEVESCGDAVGFHLKATQQYLQSGPKGWIAPSNGRVFHYGWVKDPKTMVEKKREQVTVYHGYRGGRVPAAEAKQLARDSFQFEDYAVLKEFGGSHPLVMQTRLGSAKRWAARRNRWLNWNFYREVLRRGFRG
jgi:hypothetical protein